MTNLIFSVPAYKSVAILLILSENVNLSKSTADGINARASSRLPLRGVLYTS
jgi:hypothetical protein